MRNQKKGKKIGRTAPHRKRTLQALSNALIENKRITTTVAKAKAVRPFVEPLITRAKEDTEHNRRQVFRHLQNKASIRELFEEVAERVGDRPGGYTRIIRLGQRSGDGAELAMVELVDYNDVQPADSSGGGSGGTRRGSGKGRRQPGSSDREEAVWTEEDDAAESEHDEGPKAGSGKESPEGNDVEDASPNEASVEGEVSTEDTEDESGEAEETDEEKEGD